MALAEPPRGYEYGAVAKAIFTPVPRRMELSEVQDGTVLANHPVCAKKLEPRKAAVHEQPYNCRHIRDETSRR
jgi:hypothetical protein